MSIWFQQYHHYCSVSLLCSLENRTPLLKGGIFYYIGPKSIPLFITAGSMAQSLKFFMQSQVFFNRGRGQENQVSSTVGYLKSLGGIAGICKARLCKRASEIQPSAFSSCCMMLSLLKDSPSPNTEYNNPIECIANDKLCTDK